MYDLLPLRNWRRLMAGRVGIPLSLWKEREVPSSYQVSESFFKQVFLQSPEEVSI